jgi:hypothetical protein
VSRLDVFVGNAWGHDAVTSGDPGDVASPTPPGAPRHVAAQRRSTRRPIDAGPIDAPPSWIWRSSTMRWPTLTLTKPFAADDCAVTEGCVGASGRRRLLRFATVTANLGSGDLIVGMPPPPGESNDVFQWSPCHMHHHVANYASYELLDQAGTTVITGRKQAFCLEDVEQVQPGAPATGYSCGDQGISRGWADVYSRYLPCQWIDVTGVPLGNYTLRVVVNPLHTLPESDTTNNVFTVGVTI